MGSGVPFAEGQGLAAPLDATYCLGFEGLGFRV